MINETNLRKKFPSKNPRASISAKKKAIEHEYNRKRAELGFGPPLMKRGFPYYMIIILGMLLIGGLVGSAIFKRGGIDFAGKKREKAVESLQNLAIALGRYRYHAGVYPSTEEGLGQLSKTRLNVPGWIGPYINEIKPDPWGNDYVYVNNGDRKHPTLYSKGPDGALATPDDINVDGSFFEQPFKDPSWAENWVPWHLRGYIWVENEREGQMVDRRMAEALGKPLSIEGAAGICDDWLFSTADGKIENAEVRLPLDWRAYAGRNFSEDDEAVFIRSFFVNEAAADYCIMLRIAAVSGTVSAELNGVALEVRDVGREGYEADMTKVVKHDDDNELKLKVKASDRAARSAGVIGNVWVEFSNPSERVVTGSLKVIGRKASEDFSVITVERLLECFDGTNTVVKTDVHNLTNRHPRLWTIEKPAFLKSNLMGRYMVRTIEPSTSRSVELNGRETRINGVMTDSFLGILGEAFSERQARMKFDALKEVGVNAVFFSDPKTNKAFFDLCDEVGLMAFDAEDLERLKLDRSRFVPVGGIPDEETLAYLKSLYMPDTKTLYAGPCWTFDEGANVRIECVTDADSVEFFVNGTSVGEAEKVSGFRFAKDIVYESGELKAIAKKNGVYYNERVLKTAYRPAAFRFMALPWIMKENESAVIDVALSDDYGQIVPNESREVEFVIEDGPGEFVACGNSAREAGKIDSADRRKAVCRIHNGKASVAVRRGEGSRVPLRIKAKAPGLRSAIAILPYQFR